MMKSLLVFCLAMACVYVIGCSKSGGTSNGGGGGSSMDCNTVPKSFMSDVNPIIQSQCNLASCHAAGSTNGPGPLTNYSQVFFARNQIRPVIVSGTMPQNATLTPAQKNSIICWIDSGAPNN